MSSGFPFGLRAHDYGRLSPAGLAARLAAAGASHAQLAPSKALLGIDAASGSLGMPDASSIAEAFRAAGLRISVLGCYVDLLPGAAGSAASARARFLESLESAGTLGAGLVATESFGSPEVQRLDACPRAFLKALEGLAARAEELGVDIAIEPVHSHRVPDARAMAALFAGLGSARLHCLLDPVNLIDPREPRGALEGALACVELFGDRIAALHVKDYLPGHGALAVLPPGKGLFPFEAFFKRASALGLRCDFIIEGCAPEALEESLAFLDAEGASLVAAS